MPRSIAIIVVALTVTAGIASPARGGNRHDPLLLGGVALNRTHIVFASAGDLWIVPRAGGDAVALTSGPEEDGAPVLSPDGRSVAFARGPGRARDVCVIDVAGGEPRRLTWHPKSDTPCAWSPDGTRIIFHCDREGDGLQRLHAIPATGGWPEALPLPRGADLAFLPGGREAAYVASPPITWFWTRYRGGMRASIRLVDLDDASTRRFPSSDGNDWRPMWTPKGIAFLSDRDGTANLWLVPAGKSKARALTAYRRYGVDDAAAAADAIALIHDGNLELLDLASGEVRRVAVTIAPDTAALAPGEASAGDAITTFNLSADGAHALFGARGDVLAVATAADGGARNLTRSAASTERNPAWSPDGAHIAWFSDRDGGNRLEIARAADARVVRSIVVGDAAAYFGEPAWSPDGAHLAVGNSRGALWLVDTRDGAAGEVDRSAHPADAFAELAWSPDSRLLAWSRRDASGVSAIHLLDVASGRRVRVTDGTRSARLPVFDRAGGTLLFVVSTFEPAASQFGLSSRLYAGLEAGEIWSVRTSAMDAASGAAPRARPVRTDPRRYQALHPGRPGELRAVVAEPAVGPARPRGAMKVLRIDLATGRAEALLDDAGGGVVFSADGRAALTASRGEYRWVSIDSAGAAGAPVTIDLAGAVAPRDPAAEWTAMYRDAWRLMREYFYDPGYHGQDLAALEAHYAGWLARVTRRSDLNRLMTRMFAHLSVSHLDVGGGDLGAGEAPEPLPVGMPGADFEVSAGGYRIRTILRGDDSEPLLAAPLDQPGIEAREGDYLIAVDGMPVDASREIYAWFEGKGRAPVELTTSSHRDGRDARTSRVRLIPGENTLRRRAWAEGNRRRVEERSGGRLGYIHVPDTGARGFEWFARQFVAAAGREGLVIDDRFNSGGAPADWMIDLLATRPLSAYAFRGRADLGFPVLAVPGPRVMIVNENAGSGGDTLPWMFRRAGLGPIVGRTTLGAGIGGYLDIPALLDGGEVSIPTRGFFNPDGSWDIENRGVIPDEEIDIGPADWRAGRDPQLERAIELAMKSLPRSATPARRPEFPRYP